ncbi:PLC-like phosphodiesterase [Stachybotrys elegans]|uniref:PLC-like phosphodiesterase n=1 Tax=Stachybotrys elegans TaxID=80388 RepID=A0A8K0T270_9HYPO|nr:PLC-like phosphodiesterase [Stachybotrys elegans]
MASVMLGLVLSTTGVDADAAPTGGPAGGTNGRVGRIPCNNSPDLCARQYNHISHLGAHNSAFVRDASNNNSIAGNQYLNATTALDAGLRLLQAQVHLENDTLHLCHGSCQLFDAGLLQHWLAPLTKWLDENPNDVVTLLLVNADEQPAEQFGHAFEASGLAEYGYVQPSPGATNQWPTLEAMIAAGTRLVSFITNIEPSPSHAYLLNEFDYVFETHYAVTELDGFNCTLDRPTNVGDAAAALTSSYLSLVNHFKYQELGAGIMVPDVELLDIVNSPGATTDGNLGLHVQRCTAEWTWTPNFILVDFWDEAGPIAAVDDLNVLSDVTGRRTVSRETTPEEEAEESGKGGDDDGDGDGESAANRDAAMVSYYVLSATCLAGALMLV